jgi:hypothetical protein
VSAAGGSAVVQPGAGQPHRAALTPGTGGAGRSVGGLIPESHLEGVAVALAGLNARKDRA